ncbi:MAG: dUTPase, partial [Gammaproteobacteria bacterium]
MLSPEQAATMLSLQSGMNTKVDPDWVTARYPYLRAVVVEATEAIEHHGWKWWKHQEKDLAQLQMELIDIWHFLLSEMLLRHAGDQSAALRLLLDGLQSPAVVIRFDGKEFRIDQLDLVEKLELLAAVSVTRRIELSLFASIMSDCAMDWTEWYRQYVGKNVLNFF